MDEHDACAVGTRLWGVGQQAIAPVSESLHVCLDVVGLEADVVQSATALFEVFLDGTFAVERMHQLNPGAVDGQKSRLGLGGGNIFPAGGSRPMSSQKRRMAASRSGTAMAMWSSRVIMAPP